MKITIRFFKHIVKIRNGKVSCKNKAMKEIIEGFVESGLTTGPQCGYISILTDAFGDNVQLLSVSEEEEDILY